MARKEILDTIFEEFGPYTKTSLTSETCNGYPKRKKPDPSQTRNRVGLGTENQFISGLGTRRRFSGFNFFVRVGFGFKNQLFFGKILKLA